MWWLIWKVLLAKKLPLRVPKYELDKKYTRQHFHQWEAEDTRSKQAKKPRLWSLSNCLYFPNARWKRILSFFSCFLHKCFLYKRFCMPRFFIPQLYLLVGNCVFLPSSGSNFLRPSKFLTTSHFSIVRNAFFPSTKRQMFIISKKCTIVYTNQVFSSVFALEDSFFVIYGYFFIST